MERQLLKQHMALADLIHAFSKTRELRHIPKLFGLTEHPELKELKAAPSQLLTKLVRVFYRCDLGSMFCDLGSESKKHKSAKRKADDAALNLQKKSSSSILGHTLSSLAIHYH